MNAELTVEFRRLAVDLKMRELGDGAKRLRPRLQAWVVSELRFPIRKECDDATSEHGRCPGLKEEDYYVKKGTYGAC